MMKKLMASVAVVATLLTGVLGFSNQSDDIGVVRENGYMVLADFNADTSTIVATVQDNDVDGDGYVIATNSFDSNDWVAINKMDLHKGDSLLITFYNDEVVQVQKNNLDIIK